jgi:cytochrome c
MNLPTRFTSHALAAGAALIVCFSAGAARAEGDADKGKAAFVRQCAICHTIEKGDPNRFGPNLSGIVGKKAGAVPGFDYTRAFKSAANWEWTEDALASWIMFPGVMVPGTAMAIFQGVAERDRDDIVAYLASKK